MKNYICKYNENHPYFTECHKCKFVDICHFNECKCIYYPCLIDNK